jgi:von Willebrand factor type A domain/Aerotolerance regulator N-terminal
MTFLNLSLLAGAAGLLIPIIIHLFHKSRFQIVKWGAMHLLETVIRINRRRVRIEQIILLIVRAALPLFLALAMARPIWKGAQKLLGEAKSSTVVLLDNSYSMQASRAGQSNFALATDEAARVINNLQRGSEVQVVLMGEGGATLTAAPTYDTARAAQALGKLDAGYGSATVPDALEVASGIFDHMHESARSLVVLTDFQRVSFEATEDALLGRALDRLKKSSTPPDITFFEIGEEVRDNVAVESLEFSKLMVGVGQKIQIRANLRNYGDANYSDLRVYCRVDGREKSASQVSLPPHSNAQALFSHAFDKAGSHVVEVYADADPLKADNSYFASIPVRDKLPVLLVNGNPSAEPLKGETDFAEIALQPYSAGKVDLADLISTRVVPPDQITAQALANAAVVIVANVRKFDDNQLHALEDFVKNGGGLLICPGDRIDSAWYNGPLFNDGKGLLPLSLGVLAGDLKENSPAAGIVSERFENPALELFNDPRNGSFGDAAIKLWFKFKDAGAPARSVLARLDTGDPFLIEKQFGEGHVIACATALNGDWSNLPMRPSFLPLLQRLTVYLASTVYPPRNLEVGATLSAFLPAADVGKKATLVTAEETTLQLPIVKKGDRGVLEYQKTLRPGLYTLTPPSGDVIHYVVNANRKESDLQRLTPQEIADFAKAHGVRVVHSGAEYQQIEHTLRYGHELWKPVLWTLLALCFLELFLQQLFARSRGSALTPAPSSA